MKTKLTLLLSFLITVSIAQNSVTLFSGKKITGNKLIFKTPLFKKNYFLLDNKRYEMRNVKFYEKNYELHRNLEKIYNYKMFAKNETRGKINLYYIIQTSHSPGMATAGGGMTPGMTTSSKRYFFDVDGENIQKYKYKNLKPYFEKNADITESYNSFKKYRKNTRGLFFISAVSVIATSFALSRAGNDEEGEISSTTYGIPFTLGLTSAIVGFFRKNSESKKVKRLIEEYNLSYPSKNHRDFKPSL